MVAKDSVDSLASGLDPQPSMATRGSSPLEHAEEPAFQQPASTSQAHKTHTIESGAATAPADLIPCIFGFPVPPGTRVVELFDSLPTNVDSVIDLSSSISAGPSTSSNKRSTPEMSASKTPSDDFEAQSNASMDSPLNAFNAWRHAIRDCANSAEAAADRLSVLKQNRLRATSVSSAQIRAVTSRYSFVVPQPRGSSMQETSPSCAEASSTDDIRPATQLRNSSGSEVGCSSSPNAYNGDGEVSSYPTVAVNARCEAHNFVTSAEATRETGHEASAASLQTQHNQASPQGGRPSMRRRGTFGQTTKSDVGHHEPKEGSENGHAIFRVPNRRTSQADLSSSTTAPLQSKALHVPELKRRPASMAAISPFSLSLASHASDDTEYISDELCPEPVQVTDPRRHAATDPEKGQGVPASVVKQLLDGTVGSTRAPAKNAVHLGALQVLHRELAKLRISTLLRVVSGKTSEVVCDLIANQVVAYLYFVEDSELSAWTLRSLHQRRDAPAKQWSQIRGIVSDYQPLQPPASNVAPQGSVPSTPPASPWRKHLLIFGRKSHHDQDHRDGDRSTRPSGQAGKMASRERMRNVQDDTAAVVGIKASDMSEFISQQLKTRAVHCLSLEVLVAISNLCVHRVFAPILLRRLLSFFALGDTENGFVPIEAEVKLLSEYRDRYLRPQSALLRARIKEFSPELEVEAMLRAFEAASSPRSFLPTFLKPLPSDAPSERSSTAPGRSDASSIDDWNQDISQSASVLCAAYTTPLWPCGGVGEAPPSRVRSDDITETVGSDAVPGSSALSKKLLYRVGHGRARSTSVSTAASTATFERSPMPDKPVSVLDNGSTRSHQKIARRPATSHSSKWSDGSADSRPGSRGGAHTSMVAAIDELVNLRAQTPISPRGR
ncbi:hypothetical protein ACQY0O_004244 [Thecaphora frezii]